MDDAVFSPKVSIVIPVYNGANFLKESIDSALSQTYANIEVIVVNDGSDDQGQTEEIALSYGDKIRYFRKNNAGVSSALNYGIKHMTGSYFSWLSHDDLYAPTKIADSVDLLKKFPEKRNRTIAFTSGQYIDETSRVLRPFPYKFIPDRLYDSREMVEYLCKCGTLNGCCMLIPKSAFEEFGGFDESLRYSQDTLMWLTLFFGGCCLISDGRDNVMNRLHGGQVSRNRHDLFIHDSMKIAERLAPDMAKYSDRSNNLLYLYALRMAKHNCGEVVRYYQNFASQHCPFTLLQRLNLALRLIYGRFRGNLKTIYYRFILKAGT